MTITDEMTMWAEARLDRLAEEARKAANLLRTAERDLEGIRCGRPTIACTRRFWDWRGCQPQLIHHNTPTAPSRQPTPAPNA